MIVWMSGLDDGQNRDVNLFMILLLITGFLVSTFLNPIIILYYKKNKSEKLSRKLFMLLAVSDLLTNNYPVLHIVWFCASNKYNFGVNAYSQTMDQMFRHYAVPSLIMCTFGCLSQVTTSILAVVRMISIFRPFLRYPQWAFITYIVLYTAVMAFNNFGFAYAQFLHPSPAVRRIINFTVDTCYWMNIVQCVLGIVASLLTMVRIFSKRRIEDKRIRSCWIILLMNIPYAMSCINFLLSKTNLAKYGYVYLSFVAVPCFTSMFNPLIIVLLNKEIREFTELLLTKGVMMSFRSRKQSRLDTDKVHVTLSNPFNRSKSRLEEKTSENF